jgi:Short C-terminal domain
VGLLDSLFGGARMSDPVPGQAQVVSASSYNGRAVYQTCNLTLVVQADGVAPVSVRHTCIAPAKKWPFPGSVLPVTVDRANPQQLKVEWDRVEKSGDRAARTAEAIAAQMRAMQAAPPAPPAAAPAPAPDDDDVVDELTKLAQLHASGALTDEEFAAAKKKVLEGH